MPIPFRCHQCGATGTAQDRYAGKRTKCRCGAILLLGASPDAGNAVESGEVLSADASGIRMALPSPASPDLPDRRAIEPEAATPQALLPQTTEPAPERRAAPDRRAESRDRRLGGERRATASRLSACGGFGPTELGGVERRVGRDGRTVERRHSGKRRDDQGPSPVNEAAAAARPGISRRRLLLLAAVAVISLVMIVLVVLSAFSDRGQGLADGPARGKLGPGGLSGPITTEHREIVGQGSLAPTSNPAPDARADEPAPGSALADATWSADSAQETDLAAERRRRRNDYERRRTQKRASEPAHEASHPRSVEPARTAIEPERASDSHGAADASFDPWADGPANPAPETPAPLGSEASAPPLAVEAPPQEASSSDQAPAPPPATLAAPDPGDDSRESSVSVPVEEPEGVKEEDPGGASVPMTAEEAEALLARLQKERAEQRQAASRRRDSEDSRETNGVDVDERTDSAVQGGASREEPNTAEKRRLLAEEQRKVWERYFQPFEGDAERFTLIQTAHYHIYTDAPAGSTFEKYLEFCYEFVRTQFPFGDRAEPLLALVFKTRGEYNAFSRAITGHLKPEKTAGHAYGEYYATYYQSPNSSVVYHEATHQIVRHLVGLQEGGSWLQEGLAVYIEGAIAGISPSQGFRSTVNNGQHTPLKEFIGSRALIESPDAHVSYQQAGSVIDFMKNGIWKSKFAAFLDAHRKYRLTSAAQQIANLEAIYGVPLEKFEAAWVAYLRNPVRLPKPKQP